MPTELTLDLVVLTLSNGSGPAQISSSLENESDSVNVTTYNQSLNSTTGDLVVAAIGPGLYSVSIYGGSGTGTGAFATDWSVTLMTSVTAVPLPAAGWLLISGLGGLAAAARRHRSPKRFLR